MARTHPIHNVNGHHEHLHATRTEGQVSNGASAGGRAFQPVLTMRGRIREEDAASFTREALREIRSYIRDNDLEVEGPPFSICRPRPNHRVDVEAGWPARGAPGKGHIHSGMLPAGVVGGGGSGRVG